MAPGTATPGRTGAVPKTLPGGNHGRSGAALRDVPDLLRGRFEALSGVPERESSKAPRGGKGARDEQSSGNLGSEGGSGRGESQKRDPQSDAGSGWHDSAGSGHHLTHRGASGGGNQSGRARHREYGLRLV